VLIREEPATELTVATRILAHANALAGDGRIVLLTGEVVYLASEGISNHTMTPYDVTIVRLRDGVELFGTAARRRRPLPRRASGAARGASCGTRRGWDDRHG